MREKCTPTPTLPGRAGEGAMLHAGEGWGEGPTSPSAHATRSTHIGATFHHAGLAILYNRADTAGLPLPLAPPVHAVAHSIQRIRSFVAEPPLHAHAPWRIIVWVGRAGETGRGEAGLLDRLLRRHVEHHHVEENLQHCLWLNVIAWRAERHDPPVAAHCNRRIRCQPRPLAGRQARGMRGIRP